MLKLIATLTSPYARKVRIALVEKKIEYALEPDSPWVAGNAVVDFNPLGKIPILVLDDGTRLYDSRVIVEYLDTVSPVSRLIPEPSRQRIAVKRWEALADGLCDAAAAINIERKRPARQQSIEWIERRVVDRALPEWRRSRRTRLVQRRGHTPADTAIGRAGYPTLSRDRLWRLPQFGEAPKAAPHRRSRTRHRWRIATARSSLERCFAVGTAGFLASKHPAHRSRE